MPEKPKMNEEETNAFAKAFHKAKGKPLKAKNAAGEAAVKSLREGKKGFMKAIDAGIKGGSIRGGIKARQKKIADAG